MKSVQRRLSVPRSKTSITAKRPAYAGFVTSIRTFGQRQKLICAETAGRKERAGSKVRVCSCLNLKEYVEMAGHARIEG